MNYIITKPYSEFKNDVIMDNYDSMTTIRAYRNIKNILASSDAEKNKFINENPLLFYFYNEVCKKFNNYDAEVFYNNVIIKGYLFDMEKVLEELYLRLNINKDNIKAIGRGQMGFVFKINDNFVLKISINTNTYNIPMFYRVNDFIYRRKVGEYIVAVSPYAYLDDITTSDVFDLVKDFREAGYNITDTNIFANVGIVDYEISDDERLYVDGVYHITAPVSESYTLKKVKLIDQDFIEKLD